MKYLKLFEESKPIFKVGDIVYCIDNIQGQELEIGKKYVISEIVTYKGLSGIYYNVYGIETFRGINGERFTKDPYHPIIIQHQANKYNL
jgi:hypothetical protein